MEKKGPLFFVFLVISGPPPKITKKGEGAKKKNRKKRNGKKGLGAPSPGMKKKK